MIPGYKLNKRAWDDTSPVAGTIADTVTRGEFKGDNPTNPINFDKTRSTAGKYIETNQNNPGHWVNLWDIAGRQALYSTGRIAKGFVHGVRDLANLGIFGYGKAMDKLNLDPQRMAIAKRKADITYGLPTAEKEYLRKQMNPLIYPSHEDAPGYVAQSVADISAYDDARRREQASRNIVSPSIYSRASHSDEHAKQVRNRAQSFLASFIPDVIPDPRVMDINRDQDQVQNKTYNENKNLSNIAKDVSATSASMTDKINDFVTYNGGENVPIHPADSDLSKLRATAHLVGGSTSRALPVVTSIALPARGVTHVAGRIFSPVPVNPNAAPGAVYAAKTFNILSKLPLFAAKHPTLGFAVQGLGDTAMFLGDTVGTKAYNKVNNVNGLYWNTPVVDVRVTGDAHNKIRDIANAYNKVNNTLHNTGYVLHNVGRSTPTAAVLRSYRKGLGFNHPGFWNQWLKDAYSDSRELSPEELDLLKRSGIELYNTVSPYVDKKDFSVKTR